MLAGRFSVPLLEFVTGAAPALLELSGLLDDPDPVADVLFSV